MLMPAVASASIESCLAGEFSIPRLRACLGSRAVGALRASVGIATISSV
jgi:hypothetical protein